MLHLPSLPKVLLHEQQDLINHRPIQTLCELSQYLRLSSPNQGEICTAYLSPLIATCPFSEERLRYLALLFIAFPSAESYKERVCCVTVTWSLGCVRICRHIYTYTYVCLRVDGCEYCPEEGIYV